MEHISQFLLKFSFIRVLRSFLRSKVTPWLKYFYYVSLIVICAVTPYWISKNPEQFQVFKNKLAAHYIEFVGGGDSYYNKVTISGNDYTQYGQISQIIRERVSNFAQNEDYSQSSIKVIKDKIKELPWVKNVVISRNLPNDLSVKIEEYKPFAIWNINQKHYVIDKEGKKIIAIDDIEEFPNLIILSGQKANVNVKSLLDVLIKDLEVGDNIYSATWVGSRRWDVRFNNNLLVKFPESNLSNAWQKLVQIYNMPGSLIDLKVIDLRLDDKVFLEYNNNSVKYLKDF